MRLAHNLKIKRRRDTILYGRSKILGCVEFSEYKKSGRRPALSIVRKDFKARLLCGVVPDTSITS